MISRLLRKFVGGDAKDEARAALQEARETLAEAETRAAEIQKVTDRIKEHGRRNHFGERLEAEMRRQFAHGS